MSQRFADIEPGAEIKRSSSACMHVAREGLRIRQDNANIFKGLGIDSRNADIGILHSGQMRDDEFHIPPLVLEMNDRDVFPMTFQVLSRKSSMTALGRGFTTQKNRGPVK